MNRKVKQYAKIQTYNLKELSALYRVCTKTMKRMINKLKDQLGDRGNRRLYFVNEVEIIFNAYGIPEIQQPVQQETIFNHAA
jgi:hypothetical protein